jgi:hypothetical protein
MRFQQIELVEEEVMTCRLALSSDDLVHHVPLLCLALVIMTMLPLASMAVTMSTSLM